MTERFGRNLETLFLRADSQSRSRRRCTGSTTGCTAGLKIVVQLTGANERTVRNWFDAKNGPSGELLVALCRHSDEVLATVLTLAGRELHVRALQTRIGPADGA